MFNQVHKQSSHNDKMRVRRSWAHTRYNIKRARASYKPGVMRGVTVYEMYGVVNRQTDGSARRSQTGFHSFRSHGRGKRATTPYIHMKTMNRTCEEAVRSIHV